jgi:hypothetical protein
MGSYGRPKLADEERRTALSLNVRFNAREKGIVEAKAQQAGLTLTEWARLAAIGSRPPTRRVIPEINRAAWLELSKLAATLNHAIWRFRPGDEHGLRAAIERVREQLASVRNGLIGNTEEPEKWHRSDLKRCLP